MKPSPFWVVFFGVLASSQMRAVAQNPAGEGVQARVIHATVIDVLTGKELKDQTVRVQGGRIVSVSATEEQDKGLADAIDAHGGFLIPGLWDMHVHVHDTQELPLYVANGVTGVRVMSGDKDEAGLRVELGRRSPSPAIYLASAIVDGSSPMWPGSIVVKKAADARTTVDAIKASGADFIKVYDGVPRDAYFALAEEAKAQHIDFEGHVPEAITAQEASAVGQRSIEHLTGIALACSKRQEDLMPAMQWAQFFLAHLTIEAEGYRSFDEAKCQALFGEFKRNDTWQVPTLTVSRMRGHLDDSKVISDPRLAYVDRKSRGRWEDRTLPQKRRWNESHYAMARGVFSAEEHIVGGMYRTGVPLMAGTDAMNPYCFPGFSLHDELVLLVEAGLPPIAALQAATINPARFMRRTADLGTIEAGKEADMVLLRADPLADIHNTKQIEAVWLHGQYFDRVALDGLLEAAKKEAKH